MTADLSVWHHYPACRVKRLLRCNWSSVEGQVSVICIYLIHLDWIVELCTRTCENLSLLSKDGGGAENHYFELSEQKGFKMSAAKEDPTELGIERPKSRKSHEFDDILDMVGGFGRYTFALYAFMCVMSLPIGLQQLVQVFYGATPKYSCVSFSSPNNATCSETTNCCPNCVKYEFQAGMTSAVTEVRMIL